MAGDRLGQARCKCADGKNVDPIMCRCKDHPSSGVCTGFGSARFNGSFLLDNVTLPDGTSLAAEQRDVYDMREYPGMDKAVIWAVRGLMPRECTAHQYCSRLQVLAG